MQPDKSAAEHVAAVQQAYAAFGRGDVEGVLALLAEDAVFDSNAAQPPAPWFATFRGREDIRRFFHLLAQGAEFQRFEPTAFVASGDLVLAVVRVRFTIRATGKVVEDEHVHAWRVGPRGKLLGVRHHVDTAQVERAMRA